MSWKLATVGMLMACACGGGDAGADAAPAADAGCPAGLTRCGSLCVDTDIDVNHCGRCYETCPDGPAGTPVCVAGSCGFDCVAGRYDCDDDVAGCEADLMSPSACGSCGHVCSGDDSCDAPDCRGSRQPVANSTFAGDLSSWLLANNPVNAVDTVSTFRYNGDGDAENVPSTGPCARVLYQDVLIPPDIVGAVFSAEVRSFNDQLLHPELVTSIETQPNDGVSDAFRIDFVDPNDDVFYAPILFTLFAPTAAVGTQAEPFVVTDGSPQLVQFLRQRAGTLLRLRVAQVESNVPWHLDVDNMTLTSTIVY